MQYQLAQVYKIVTITLQKHHKAMMFMQVVSRPTHISVLIRISHMHTFAYSFENFFYNMNTKLMYTCNSHAHKEAVYGNFLYTEK